MSEIVGSAKRARVVRGRKPHRALLAPGALALASSWALIRRLRALREFDSLRAERPRDSLAAGDRDSAFESACGELRLSPFQNLCASRLGKLGTSCFASSFKMEKTTARRLLIDPAGVNPGQLRGNLTVPVAQHIIVVFDQRSAEVDSFAGLSEVIRQTCKYRTANFLLNALEDFVITLVPTVDDDAYALRLNSETLES